MTHLRAVRLDGGRRSLFREEFVINEATRPAEPDHVPRLWLWFAPIGLALAALVLWLSQGLRSGGRRRTAAFTISFLAAVIGILGTIITALVALTDHTAAHANENFFMLNPLWLVIAALTPAMILHQRPRHKSVVLVSITAVLACAAVLIHLGGWSRQGNWDAIFLVLPVELSMAWTLARLSAAEAMSSDFSASAIPRPA